MPDYILKFERYLKDEKHSSANTVESYLRDIHQYNDYCTVSGKFDYCRAASSDVQGYLNHLKLYGKSEATCSRILASLRCFYRFLFSVNAVALNPVDGIKLKKAEQKLPDILDAKEVTLLLEQPNGNDCKSVRDKAMLELLYATGIKVSELIDLNLSDVNLQIGIIHMSDSRHERVIPLYPAAVRTLSNYLLHIRPAIVLDAEEERLFTNMNGQPLSRQGLWKIIKFYAEKAGIKKDITPHTLRHSFAAHLLENGAELKDIKEMLGHSDISSTQIYAQFLKNKYTQTYAKYHPLAHK